MSRGARPVLLGGPPAAGKSTTARRCAEALDRAAVVDVDDLRQLIVSGHVAVWEGQAGHDQHLIGVANACDLAARFAAHGYDVIIADVLTEATLAVYRRRLPDLLTIGLRISRATARRRAAGRPWQIDTTDFDRLHDTALAWSSYDRVVEVDTLDLDSQVTWVLDVISAASTDAATTDVDLAGDDRGRGPARGL